MLGLCPAYNICEECEAGTYAHDPNHVLLKLRRPIPCVTDSYSLAELSPRLPATLEQVRLQKQMDKRFLKAENGGVGTALHGAGEVAQAAECPQGGSRPAPIAGMPVGVPQPLALLTLEAQL